MDIKPGDFAGRYVRFGIREHAMGAMLNGLALHGGIIPYGGTFLVFSDYMRGAVRLSAIMKAPGRSSSGRTTAWAWARTARRTSRWNTWPRCARMPNLVVFRPADANETAAAWRYALTHRDRPVALLLSRQNLPVLPGTEDPANAGPRRLHPGRCAGGKPDVLLIGDRLGGHRGDGRP